MLYCPKCSRLCPVKCPKCRRTKGLRPARESDPVLLLETDVMQASMVEPVLEEMGVPFSRSDRMGWGLTLQVGTMLESVALYVPFGAYDKCRERLEETFEAGGGILLALRANDP